MSKKIQIQIILSFVFGVIFVSALLGFALFIPSPSDFQYTIFRVVLALAGGGVAAAFPGIIEVNFGSWLRAGGTLAVFSIVYFYNPAEVIAKSIRYECIAAGEKTICAQGSNQKITIIKN